MKLEDQVVSFELAREMKEMGAEQDSIWYWTWVNWNEETEWVIISQYRVARTDRETFSAYTMAELCEMLPAAYHSHELIIDRGRNGSWNVRYISGLGNDPWTGGKTVADALAQMWILKENNDKERRRNAKDVEVKEEMTKKLILISNFYSWAPIYTCPFCADEHIMDAFKFCPNCGGDLEGLRCETPEEYEKRMKKGNG